MESTSTTNSSLNDSVDSLEKSVYSIKLGDINYEDTLKLAEEYKEAGNKLMTENKASDAIQKFTDALSLNIETKKNAIYYSNRAMAHTKLENIGLAIQDANKAIEIDPDYLKAYYRRASASLMLSHYDEAIKDLQLLYTKFPSDSGLLEKLNLAKKENKKKRFFESLSSESRNEE